MSDHSSTPNPTPVGRDPQAAMLAQIGAATTIVVLVIVFAIQGLYFYFQDLEAENKLRKYPPRSDVVEAQRKSLTTSQWVDHNHLQIDIDWARQLTIEDLRKDQEEAGAND